MKTVINILFALLMLMQSKAQKVFTKEGHVTFYSKAPLENIEAHNNKALGIIDMSTGVTEFSVLLKGFEFEKALMQEHFNENYVESDKYPKATFKGTIKTAVLWKSDGTYNTTVQGLLTLHGVTKEETATATITVKNGNIGAKADMQIKLSDYGISIPALVGNKISETIKINILISSLIPLNR